MHSSREDIEFLARSRSRVEVLDALEDGSRTRSELGEMVDASRVTLDRTLNDLEDRGWIVRSDGRYDSTSRGAIVASELGRLLSVGVAEKEIPEGSESGIHRTATDMSLEDIEFLVRSPSRIEVLDSIRTESRTRDELKDATDVSRATLSRILGELEERGLIDRTNHQCKPTPQGTVVAEAFDRTLSNLAAARHLEDILGWLPTNEFEFDLACLRDAEVVANDWDDPTKTIHRVAELVGDADEVRTVSPGATREVTDAVRELVVERDGTFEAVIDARGFERIRDDDVLREQFRAILGSGRATVTRREGEFPFFVVVIVDDTVVVCGSEGDEPAHEAVETDDPRVREWAESYFESLRSEADPLDVEMFTV